MQENTIRVVAAVVDTRQLTLYKEDGETIFILQGDPRLAKIVNNITPILASGPGSVAEVSLDLEDEKGPNPYRAYEEQSNGLVRLFRVAKSSLAKLFTGTKEQPVIQVDPQVLGVLPTTENRLLAATQEIIANAVPVSAPQFHDRDVGENGSSTIVAVVGDQVIPGVEKLKPQLKRAAELGNSKNIDAFMQRLATVAAQRQHSADDLLTFLEKGDLPIAEDGSIIIYKVLRMKESGLYVDCHTRKVPQRVGSYVCMSPDLVDHNRYQECSNGLHVARRGYLNGFSGDVCVLAKLAPEDVIAVPHGDANKMRVCGYHILAELSAEDYAKLKRNQPFTDTDEAKILLGRALAGDFPPPIERVEITEQYGEGVVVTPLNQGKPVPAPKAKVKPVEALTEEPEPGKLTAPPVNPKLVSQQVAEAKAETRAQKAQRLFQDFLKAEGKEATAQAAQALLDYKKSTKLGWVALGLGLQPEIEVTLKKAIEP